MRTPAPFRWILVAALVLGIPGTRLVADDATPAQRFAALRGEAVKRLHDLAEACREEHLYGLRADVYDTVLLLAPDDETARQWLRYRRTDDGWVRPPTYKRPRDRGAGRADMEQRVEAWRSWFASEAAAVATDAVARRQHDLARSVFRLAFTVTPDDALLRAADGEVRYERDGVRTWVLKETWSALRRRPALHDVATHAVENPPPYEEGQHSDDALDDVPWGPVWQGPHVRLLGTTPDEERETLYARCEATWPLFDAAFGCEAMAWTADVEGARGLTICVFADPEAAIAWYQKIPGVTADQVEFARPLAAVAVPGRPAILVKAGENVLRLEAGPRMILDSMVRTRFGITADEAWISEGLNHYLSYLLTGTRLVGTLTTFVNRTRPAANAPHAELPTALPSDDWLAAGRTMLAGEAKPDFRLLVGKKLSEMTPPEILYGYCVAAWLLEGVPDRAPAFLDAVGHGTAAGVEGLVAEHFHLDVPGFEARLLRWLEETTDLSTPPVAEKKD